MDEKAMTRAERAFVTGQQIEEKFGGCAQCVLRSLILNGCDIPEPVRMEHQELPLTWTR